MLNFFLGSPQQAEAHVQKTRFGKWARQTYRDSWASAAVDTGQPVNPEPRLQAKQGNSDSPHSFSWDKDEAPVVQHSQGKAKCPRTHWGAYQGPGDAPLWTNLA